MTRGVWRRMFSWEEWRKEVEGFGIEIKISNIKFINYDNKDILAQFTQSYNSDSFSDVVNKHFTVTLVGDVFKITGEYTLK